METEKLVHFWDEGKLAGILHLPEKQNQIKSVVIFCPGKNGERYEAHRLAVKLGRHLSQKGIAFFRFDYYGLGLSDGEYVEMTTSTKISNVKKAQNYILENYNIDPSGLFYLGFSDGARIALMASNRTRVKNLILWSPIFYEIGGNYPSNKRPMFMRYPLNLDRIVMPWAGLWSSIDFYKDLSGFDISREIDSFNGKSLLIYDDKDLLVLEEFAEKKVNETKLFHNDHNHLVEVISGAGHLFSSVEMEDRLMESTTRYLELF
ncbi:alpha/beta hydrolase [Cytobacillus pseudoceanisediminis]|uniref:alpha/beta hydrolase n=1 Tax=Cytobacillus pseudoceanisediminis TaxID=3051614 RepID=UPI003C2C1773